MLVHSINKIRLYKSETKDVTNLIYWVFAQTPWSADLQPIFTKFCIWGDVPDTFPSFEFQKDRSINGELWGGNFPSPTEKAQRLYNSLLLSHKP